MSGHSKWSQIKHQKQIGDLKKGQIFSKLANQISLAVKSAGPDPERNLKLKLAIQQARAVNMPKENIERAIKRGRGLPGEVIEEVTYEAYGPGGIAFLIEGVTDNKNRTTSQVKNILNRFGGKMGETGSTSYLFSQRGLIVVERGKKDSQQLELKIIDCGALDFEEAGSEILVYTDPRGTEIVKENLIQSGLEVKEVKLSFESRTVVKITDKKIADLILKLIDQLENVEGITAVYSNFDISDEILSSEEVK